MYQDDRSLADALRQYVNQKRDEIVDFLAMLTSVESPSLDPQSQPEVFRLLAGPLEEIGYKTSLLKGNKSGGQLFVRPFSRVKNAPCQLILGHADTVWAHGTLEIMPVEIDGNIMRGPGIYDMKAGLTQSIYALKALSEIGIQIPLTPLLFVSSDEELGSEESRNRIQLLGRRVNRVFVPEPSTGREGRLKTSRKGVGVFTVCVHGKAAHAGVEPEAGVNAILELSHIVQQLQDLNDPDRGLTVNVGVVEGGTRVNIIPSEARAEVDIRVQSQADGMELERLINEIKPTVPGTRISVSGGLDRPPLEKTEKNQRLWNQAQRMAEVLGLELKESFSGGGSDGNLTSPFTATLDGLGGVGGGAHAPHEFIYIDKLLERTSLLAMLLMAPPV